MRISLQGERNNSAIETIDTGEDKFAGERNKAGVETNDTSEDKSVGKSTRPLY